MAQVTDLNAAIQRLEAGLRWVDGSDRPLTQADLDVRTVIAAAKRAETSERLGREADADSKRILEIVDQVTQERDELAAVVEEARAVDNGSMADSAALVRISKILARADQIGRDER